MPNEVGQKRPKDKILKNKTNDSYEIKVVGGALAALGTLMGLYRQFDKNERSKLDISCLSTPLDFSGMNAASLNSSALIGRQGIERDVSPLGDLLYDAFDFTNSFLEEFKPSGVQSAIRIHYAHEDDIAQVGKLKRRFGLKVFKDSRFYIAKETCFICTPKTYLNWYLDFFKENFHEVKFQNSFICSVDEKRRVLCDLAGNEYHYDIALLCTGAHQLGTRAINGKRVTGSFLKFSDVRLSKESFIYTWSGYNFIYNAKESTVIWASDSDYNAVELFSEKMLLNAIRNFFEVFPKYSFTFDAYEKLSALRLKAPKRMPYVNGDDRLIEINGLYKNGYTLGLHLGNMAAQRVYRFINN